MRCGGLIAAAPPCSAHVFMCSSKTKKSKWNPRGDLNSETCILGNCTATRTILGLLVGIARGVYFILEQPSSSVLVHLPAMIHLFVNMHRLRLGQHEAVRLWLASTSMWQLYSSSRIRLSACIDRSHVCSVGWASSVPSR